MKVLFLISFVILIPFIACDNNANITYTYWVGSLEPNNNLTIFNLNITAPEGTPFYKIMKIAAHKDRNYRFEAKDFDLGHYITKIGKWRESKFLNLYWFIFKLSELPNPWVPPTKKDLTPVGVDEILIENNGHYLFWLTDYNKLND